MRWIGFTGKMGAGKDHALGALTKLVPEVVRVSFADQLRFEIERELGVDLLPALWTKPYPESIRRLTQWWGTDFRREQDPDYWVKLAEEQAVEAEQDGWVPVFTDVRYPNEADMIRRHGGAIIRVWAPDFIRAQRLGLKEVSQIPDHPSESAMDEYEVDAALYSTMNSIVYKDQIGTVARFARGEG